MTLATDSNPYEFLDVEIDVYRHHRIMVHRDSEEYKLFLKAKAEDTDEAWEDLFEAIHDEVASQMEFYIADIKQSGAVKKW